MDEGRATPCCQFASDEDLESDPAVYQCGSCGVMAQIDALHPLNREAWELFQRTCTRFLVDGHGVSAVLEKLGEGEDVDDFLDLVTRFSILYDVYYPPKRKGAK